MRFGFVTCVQLGLSCMEAIYEAGGGLDLAITLQDDMARAKSGRVYLDEFCCQHGVDLVKIRNINHAQAISAVLDRHIDWLFIVGWSQIARAEILNAPRRGVLGMHPTLLPVGRGRAAIPWAILKQLEKTGVTLFQLDEGVDTGPVLALREIPLTPSTDAGQLYNAVSAAHADLMRSVFPALVTDQIAPSPQIDDGASEWPGRTPEDGAIDRDGSVHEAERLVRATTRPYPGAFVEIDGQRITIWRAEIMTVDATTEDHVLTFSDGRLRCIEWEERT